MSQGPIYLFSDAHLGAGDASAEDRKLTLLEGFLAHVRSRPGAVYLNGDLFDFWFEYRQAIPRGHLRCLAALLETVRSGCPVTYVAGNHDFWVGDYLHQELGIQVEPGPVELELQGRRIFLAHGDGVLKRDGSYRLMRSILRSPLNNTLYRWIHPDLGIPLALAVSRRSAGRHHVDKPIPLDEIRAEVVLPQFARGRDAVVLGHFHTPLHERGDGTDFLILGDWMRHFTYVTLEGGVFQLWRWNEGKPVAVAPQAPPAAAGLQAGSSRPA
jgi:UDP-2,3-diacylglucosamine hydrolase